MNNPHRDWVAMDLKAINHLDATRTKNTAQSLQNLRSQAEKKLTSVYKHGGFS